MSNFAKNHKCATEWWLTVYLASILFRSISAHHIVNLWINMPWHVVSGIFPGLAKWLQYCNLYWTKLVFIFLLINVTQMSDYDTIWYMVFLAYNGIMPRFFCEDHYIFLLSQYDIFFLNLSPLIYIPSRSRSRQHQTKLKIQIFSLINSPLCWCLHRQWFPRFLCPLCFIIIFKNS